MVFHTKKLCSRLSSREVQFLELGEGLGATYVVLLMPIGKCVVDVLLVIIQLFSLGVTALALKKISVFCSNVVSLPKFQVQLSVPHQPFFVPEN